jgi:hypothetical protein
MYAMAFLQRKYRSWIPGIAFWILFLSSIALGRRYRWIDAVWNVAWLVVLFLVATASIIHIFRNRGNMEGRVGYRGVPRWVVTMFGGETERFGQSTPERVDQR